MYTYDKVESILLAYLYKTSSLGEVGDGYIRQICNIFYNFLICNLEYEHKRNQFICITNNKQLGNKI